MSGVEDIQAGIVQASSKARESIDQIERAISDLESGLNALTSAAQGSEQEEVQRAPGMMNEAIQVISDVKRALGFSMDAVENYANRL
ncbi:hypothetical protein LZ318_35175 [Saccharopolyspora indica]|uniref:hypothetical protein n=1 Tax=Saccharopolyspora indica TaxID=1229659 RepID=UPI0022EAAF29|nr:hypothetical protein [Saccharopolyspora indica]MDA3649829.1 hypothetical protein [Saccharopolyspora indica]